MSKVQRIDVEQVRRATKDDCRGTALWRVLVSDLLDELVETRRAADENAKANDAMSYEIARCHGWLLHFNENGMVQDEAQMAVDGADSPKCSTNRSADPDVPPLAERVNHELCGECFASGFDEMETCPSDDKCSEWYERVGLRPPAKAKEKMNAPAVPADLSDWQSSISGDGFRWDAPGVEVTILSGHPGATLVVGRNDKVTSRLSVVVAGRDKIEQARIALRAALLTGLVREMRAA